MNIYIDESGTDKTNLKDPYFSIAASIISDNHLKDVELKVQNFKQKYSRALNFKINILHDNEIEDGLERGQGRYELLYKSDLGKQFIADLIDILKSSTYELVAVTTHNDFLIESFASAVREYYRKRGERISSSKLEFQFIYITLLLELFSVFKYMSNLKNAEHCVIYIEEKNQGYFNDQGKDFIQKAFIHHINQNTRIAFQTKQTDRYPAGMELIDLNANTLRKQAHSNYRSKQYSVIQDKVVKNSLLSNDRMLEIFSGLGRSSK